MSPTLRKFTLTAHVTSSVGWLGAVACFLVLATVGMTTTDPQLARATYVVMELIGWAVIVPLSFASLITGLVQSWSTPWGLFRHYWVVAKLLINLLATVVLLVHMKPIGHLADAAATAALTDDLTGTRWQVTADAAAAVLVLLLATALSVFKPKGRIRHRPPRSYPNSLTTNPPPPHSEPHPTAS
ncbi:hypothetical protein [Saccharothrix sp. NRRL B-16348]|uniref:hypothetical protein n=1 Tax=Saccharothrix sp. NRRL B-16348 TaxID=1415542 RepID=UPI0007C79460|nr:hypothetical protein [Saccharothrix sp. NRRL B-16348]